MATISSVFKMQDQATKTFDKVASAMDTIITKADELSTKASTMDALAFQKVNPKLSQAIGKYQDLISKQEEINAKIDLISMKEKAIANQLKVENSLYQKNEKAISRLQIQQATLATQKDNLIKKSDLLNNKIYQQAGAVNNVAKSTGGLEGKMNNINGGLSEWQSKLLTFNQTLQAVKSVAQGVQSVLNYADSLTLSNSRLGLINDGLQTQEQLQHKIYAAAQRSRGSYEDLAKSVAKLGLLAGDSFRNNDEMIAFSEMMNKSFKVSGASQQEISSATYQLTQAMAAGKLQGDEFRSISENAPMLADAIAKYMGKSKGELKELSREGKITSDIIKAAMFNAADEINEKYEQMPRTFADSMTSIKNTFAIEFQAVSAKVSEILNSETFMGFMDKIEDGIRLGAQLALKAIAVGEKVIAWVKKNSKLITSILGGIVAYMIGSLIPTIITTTQALWAKAIAWAGANWQMVLAAAAIGLLIYGMQTMNPIIWGLIIAITVIGVAVLAWQVAQHGLNAALAACPIVWIILLIVGVIAIIYLLITWILKLVDSTDSALGIIVGAIAAAVAAIWNIFLGLLDLVLGLINAFINPWIDVANFFANIFNDPIGSIIHLFGDFADSILGIIESIAKALDKVFGSSMAESVKGWRNGLDSMVEGAADKYGNGSYEKVAEHWNLSTDTLGLDRWAYTDAWNSGVDLGNNIADAIGNFDPAAMVNSLIPDSKTDDGGYDFDSILNSNGNVPVEVNGGEVNISDEDLKMLKDIATREYMLNYKQITPNVNISFGDVRETADVGAIKNELQKMMEEELAELYVVEEAGA